MIQKASTYLQPITIPREAAGIEVWEQIKVIIGSSTRCEAFPACLVSLVGPQDGISVTVIPEPSPN
jgi:hypothetical protein